MSSLTENTGWGALLKGPSRPIAIIIAVAIALQSANIYVASAVLPSVAADIGGLSLYAWATTVFVLAAVIGSTATATVLGRHGTRSTYRSAILLVAAGTIVCALAPTMPVLLAGRFVQGFGGGLLFALAYTLVRLVLPEQLWARAMGLVSAMWGVGTFAGPALGGTFAELDQWRLAFWVVIPVTLFFAVWGGACLPRDAGRHAQPPSLPSLDMVEQTYLSKTNPLVVLTQVHARARATGQELDFPILQTITVEADRTSEIRPFYWDTAAIASACTEVS